MTYSIPCRQHADSVTVTIATCASTNDTDGQSIQSLMISSIRFDDKSASSITDILNHDENFSGTGLILILVEDWPLWFDKPFRQCFFNLDLDASTLLDETTAPGRSAIPSFDYGHLGLKFVLETTHRQEYLSLNFLDTANHLKAAYIGGDFIACWTSVSHGLLKRPNRPVAVVAGPKSYDLGLTLAKYYSEDERRRWTRLESCPCWIYIDIFNAFTGWTHVLEALSVDLQQSESDGYSRKRSILDRTRTLHRSIAIIIRMSELLRIHQSSITRIQTNLKRSSKRGLQDLEYRLDSMFLMLDHYAQTCQTMKEQTLNLLHLVRVFTTNKEGMAYSPQEFNTETVKQAHSVRRLQILAAVFIPLTFAATMCDLASLKPIMYPIIAVPIIAAVSLAALFAEKTWGKLQDLYGALKRVWVTTRTPPFNHGRCFDPEKQSREGESQAITSKINALWAIGSDAACDARHVYALEREVRRNSRAT